MSRKKKKTRKYKPRNEFKLNKSQSANKHFDYIFGETDTHYKSIGLTTTPNAEKNKYYELTKNPNPKDKRKSFLSLSVRSTNKKFFETKSKEDWKFAKEDMPVVRHTIKKYKKSTNRKPKNWFNKKKKKEKK